MSHSFVSFVAEEGLSFMHCFMLATSGSSMLLRSVKLNVVIELRAVANSCIPERKIESTKDILRHWLHALGTIFLLVSCPAKPQYEDF